MSLKVKGESVGAESSRLKAQSERYGEMEFGYEDLDV